MEEYLAAGQVVRPHGVKGAVKVRVLSDDPGRFRGLERVYLEKSGGHEPVRVVSASGEGDNTIVFLEGANSRDAAEALRGAFLYVRRDQALPLPEGSWYISDLIGCVVEDSEGNALGILKDVMQAGAADVYVVHGGGRELLFPALKRLLLDVDVRAKKIVVDAAVLKEVADV
jgi:16S rRNA processing protein RimM